MSQQYSWPLQQPQLHPRRRAPQHRLASRVFRRTVSVLTAAAPKTRSNQAIARQTLSLPALLQRNESVKRATSATPSRFWLAAAQAAP